MKVSQLEGSILDRHLMENARSQAAQSQAAIDYNIMMGNLDDPEEEEETDE